MYRLVTVLAFSLLLLIASSNALTVADTKPAVCFTPIQLDIDSNPSSSNAPTSSRRGAYGPVDLDSSGGCCADYPYCGCPKLETPSAAKKYEIKLPAAKQAQSDSSCSCCPDYPYCSCPKIETPPKTQLKVINIGAAAKKRRPKAMALRMRPKANAQTKAYGACCPDYPYCGCPKLETSESSSPLKIIDINAVVKTRRVKALVTANAASGSCCPDYPYCGCPKL